MKCPDCGGKIKATDYDPEYEWYECSKCEGCFTPDEIIKDELEKSKSVPAAKGKKRRTEIAEDEEAIAKHEAQMLKPTRKDTTTKHRDEVPTGQILNIMADEIEEIVAQSGGKIDRLNAREFYAMNLWRPLSVHHGVAAREAKVDHALCKKHK